MPPLISLLEGTKTSFSVYSYEVMVLEEACNVRVYTQTFCCLSVSTAESLGKKEWDERLLNVSIFVFMYKYSLQVLDFLNRREFCLI